MIFARTLAAISVHRALLIGAILIVGGVSTLTGQAAADTPGAQHSTSRMPQSTHQADAVRSLAIDGQWYCNNIGNGDVCIRYINSKTGVDIKYVKWAGGTITARFSYHDYTYNEDWWDNGPFTQSAGQTRSFAWNNTFPGCVRGFLNSGGSQFASPFICP